MELLAPRLRVVTTSDGMILECATPLPEPAATICDWLDAAPAERTFLAERTDDGGWRRLSYGEARRAAAAIAGVLPAGPVMVLSDNSIAHALVMLAALHRGVPVVPVSPAYS